MTDPAARAALRRALEGAFVALVVVSSAAAGLAVGCKSNSDAPSSATPPSNGGVSSSAKGAALYAQMCSFCHGDTGQGGQGPKLRDWSRGRSELVTIIDQRMPLGRPDQCRGDCAENIADYVLSGFASPEVVCQSTFTSPRRLRLLTKRELRATLTDLFAAPASSGGGTAGATCTPKTFTFDPAGRKLSKVHVAGSFNQWAGTVALGGWPLTFDAAKGVWTGQHDLGAGTYAYKFVLDESEWVLDPKGAGTAPDGYGGQNSTFTCSGGAGGGSTPTGPDPTAALPPDTRPEGFAFDDSADGRVVTSVAADEIRKLAQAQAQAALGQLAAIAPCATTSADAACAEQFARSFGLRAFRRPLSDVEVGRIRDLVTHQASFSTGIAAAVQAILMSPSFLYRSEIGEPQPDGTYRLTGYEMASALSYTFWGTMPDAALFDAAASGALVTPEGIEKEARRLLADPRARATVGAFAEQWLGVEPILTATKNGTMFPGFSDDVRKAMAEETRRFVTSVVFDGSHRYDELVTAKYTFVNAALAPIYGVPAPAGGDFQRVDTPGGQRAGVLGEGAVLGSYAHPDQTSPIRRGLFVRRSLLCQDLPPPPANVPSVPSVDPHATTRERFNQHTKDPMCKSCHQFIDPVGFGFEHFDPIGRYRDTENGVAVDSTGDMSDVEGLGSGTHASYASLPELGAILANSNDAKACFAKQYFRFAHGYRETADDLCALTRTLGRFKDSGYDVREMMIATVTSPDFRLRR